MSLSGSPIASIPTLIWAAQVTVAKKAARRSNTLITGTFITGMGIIPILLYSIFSHVSLTGYELLLSIGSGLFFFTGVMLYYKAIETEQIANAAGAGLIQPLLILAFSTVFLHEGVTLYQGIAGAVIVFGVLMVITLKGTKINRKLLPAILANILWSAYWILASEAIIGSGNAAMPLLFSRITTFAALMVTYILLRGKFKKFKSAGLGTQAILPASLSGLLDGAGNGLFGFMILTGLIAQASVFLVALPILITALGYVFYKERLNKIQSIGMAVAIVGAFALAIV
ncbi:MAG TPA: EamA family transporter [Candidatus Baltobacteraceae bacterium]|nr:EamA family transporter [Candidatus Baltobacteraceae bacterium]